MAKSVGQSLANDRGAWAARWHAVALRWRDTSAHRDNRRAGGARAVWVRRSRARAGRGDRLGRRWHRCGRGEGRSLLFRADGGVHIGGGGGVDLSGAVGWAVGDGWRTAGDGDLLGRGNGGSGHLLGAGWVDSWASAQWNGRHGARASGQRSLGARRAGGAWRSVDWSRWSRARGGWVWRSRRAGGARRGVDWGRAR